MMIRKSHFLVKLIALFLVLTTISPNVAYAATAETAQPYASKYLTSYNAYVAAVGSGKVQIWFHAMGTNDMDEIGTLRIMLYESSDNVNWTWKKTFLHESYSSMLAYDDYYHSSYVSYNGTAGKYYKAYVCIWAGKDGSGDTRYMWTASEKAT